MPLRLRIRLALAGLVVALLAVTVAATLQLRELASLTGDVAAPHATLLRRTAEMQQRLAAPDRGPSFVTWWQAAVSEARDLAHSDPVLAAVTELEQIEAERANDERLRDAVASLSDAAERSALEASSAVQDEATTSSIGLGIVALLVIVAGTWLLRAAKTTLVDRLEAIDDAVSAVAGGNRARRLPTAGGDELSRLADALNRVLDREHRTDAAAQGRIGALRAMLVGVLQQWPRPAALIGLDGEISVSTIDATRERDLEGLCDDLRRATKTLLSNPDASPEALESRVRVGREAIDLHVLRVGPHRVVGWLAEFQPSTKQ